MLTVWAAVIVVHTVLEVLYLRRFRATMLGHPDQGPIGPAYEPSNLWPLVSTLLAITALVVFLVWRAQNGRLRVSWPLATAWWLFMVALIASRFALNFSLYQVLGPSRLTMTIYLYATHALAAVLLATLGILVLQRQPRRFRAS
ncbi:hypothetical protein D5S17_06165 [Pseudonocardiaceae bacterium YIM PH 21723]|nr:hypothetical protein D5S17_06165 [Pseudonocardiaceae bacterium YIM PH 21723]